MELSFNNNNRIRVSFGLVVIITLNVLHIFDKQILYNIKNSFFFGWLFGCLEGDQKLVSAQPPQKIHEKLSLTETEKTHFPKQIQRSPG